MQGLKPLLLIFFKVSRLPGPQGGTPGFHNPLRMRYNRGMKTALTIAGSDPSGGAGLQMDIKVFRALGVHGFAVPASLTAQNTEEVKDILPVEADFLVRQLDTLLSDVKPDALKTGMLFTALAVEITAEAAARHSLENLVVDPVTVSSSGMSLVEDGALDAMKNRLFPLARVITPNIYEASLFTGINIETAEELEEAARALRGFGPDAVVVTGGHLEDRTEELFFDGEEFHRLEGEKIAGEYHGTGCAFSAALAAFLALEHGMLDAVRKARQFVQEAIENAHRPGRGMGMLGV